MKRGNGEDGEEKRFFRSMPPFRAGMNGEGKI
jgi:hypothetical protein